MLDKVSGQWYNKGTVKEREETKMNEFEVMKAMFERVYKDALASGVSQDKFFSVEEDDGYDCIYISNDGQIQLILEFNKENGKLERYEQERGD